MDKCSKKDCVDFDISEENFESVGSCCFMCKHCANSDQIADRSDAYLPIEMLANPTRDIPAPWVNEGGEIPEGAFEDVTVPLSNRWESVPEDTQMSLDKVKEAELPLTRTAGVYQTGPLKDSPKVTEGRDIKDSGVRTQFNTGAVRDAQGGKGRFDLLPKIALWALAHQYEKGCQKYGDRNWEKGIPIQNYMDSGARHATEYELGLQDENHLIACIWNYVCAYETLVRIKLGILPDSLDTLPYPLRGVVAGSEDVKPWDRMRGDK